MGEVEADINIEQLKRLQRVFEVSCALRTVVPGLRSSLNRRLICIMGAGDLRFYRSEGQLAEWLSLALIDHR